MRKVISLVTVLAMLVCMLVPELVLAEERGEPQHSTENETVLEEGTFIPGEIVVVFRAGAVKDSKLSLKKATQLENVDEDYGETMSATGEGTEAAEDAKSEVSILKKSLGDDFEILDSMAFDEELITALVKSEKYTTEVLIDKLKENEDIEIAEPNWRTEEKSYEYDLNDTLAKYAYQTNSAAAENRSGENVSGRGTDPKKTVSTNAGSLQGLTADIKNKDEVVVAVIDSGVNYKHEDLKNMVWTNPGNIGLEGEHGFNFQDNDTDVFDLEGHGSHCSGIIAAQANNGKGVTGTASGSGANVKIMLCAISSSDPEIEPDSADPGTYRRTGGLFYALRARQRGVNVVAASCSWGSPGDSHSYDYVIDKLGEAGILTFLAASNEAQDLDRINYWPSGTDSEYAVLVGSSDIDGRPSGFSNFGASNVDLFAPGGNILSTICYSVYNPNLYSAADRAANTEYYGEFSTKTSVGAYDESLGTNKVVADTAGEGVKPFGAVKFFAQDSFEGGDDEGGDDEGGDDEGGEKGGDEDFPPESCDLSVADDVFFTDNQDQGAGARPASLRVKIKNARLGRAYYVYLPFVKNHETKGTEDTRYSITTIADYSEGEFSAAIIGGEVVKYEKDGKAFCEMANNEGGLISPENHNSIDHFDARPDHDPSDYIKSWDEVDPEKTDAVETGIGVLVRPEVDGEVNTEEERQFIEEPHDITFCIDHAGVSRPVTEEGKTTLDAFPAESSYEIMSGTSMATPAAAGAYAAIAALYPIADGQDPADYARENRARLFSAVTRTEELKDLCSTGGYLDLSKIKAAEEGKKNVSISDAVCDVEKETITVKGYGLESGLKLYKKEIGKEGAEEVLIDDTRVSFAADGKSLTIKNAKDLFGTYTKFLLKDAEGIVRGSGAFFLVKGQKKLTQVYTEEYKKNILDRRDEIFPERYVFTDQKGKDIYTCQLNSDSMYEKTVGLLSRFDGNNFTVCNGTVLREALFDLYINKGFDKHQLTRGLTVKPLVMRQPVIKDDILYAFVDVEYKPDENAEDEDIMKVSYLASIDFTSEKPAWNFCEIESVSKAYQDLGGEDISNFMDDLTYFEMDGKIYCVGAPALGSTESIGISAVSESSASAVLALDLTTGKWEKQDDAPFMNRKMHAYRYNGKVYLMFGEDELESATNDVITFDGRTWEKKGKIPFIGRHGNKDCAVAAAVAPVRDGLVFINYSVQGAGNVFLYKPETEEYEPLYYTTGDGLSDDLTNSCQSAVETEDGIYYMKIYGDDGQMNTVDLSLLPKSSRAYRPTYKDANPMKVTASNKTRKAKTLKKKSLSLKAVTVKKASGTVAYKRTGISCARKLAKNARARIKVNSKTGKITLKKGLKKGKYTLTIRVKASGDDYYNSGTKTVKVKITVK